MNTPTHAALNFLLLARRPGSPRGLVVFAAILPDLPIFLFALFERVVLGEPWARIWREIYFRPEWQALFDAFHSIPLFAGLALWFRWRGSVKGQLFALSILFHAVVDWPTHLEDAHAYLWPFWREPLHGFVSYWHPGSPIWALELAILLAAVVVLARERRFRPAREIG